MERIYGKLYMSTGIVSLTCHLMGCAVPALVRFWMNVGFTIIMVMEPSPEFFEAWMLLTPGAFSPKAGKCNASRLRESGYTKLIPQNIHAFVPGGTFYFRFTGWNAVENS
jgi:hypothetical protein